MYEYRRMSPEERQIVVEERRKRGLPLHEPAHYPEGLRLYLISAACYEHRPIMNSDERRGYFERRLLATLEAIPDMDLRAWVILPNHYHVLCAVDLARLRPALRTLHNGTATEWNREDRALGRRVWFRFSDRLIRGERHYYASVNYVHGNPVKHGYAKLATDWTCSSVHCWLDSYGRDYIIQMWQKYPIREYGAGWDD